MAVAQASSYATTHAASQVGLCVTATMTAGTVQMSRVIARSRRAVLMNLLAITSAVYWQSGNAMEKMTAVIIQMS